MRIVIATMSHETNTFSPVVTDLDRFTGGRPEPLSGQDAVRVYSGTASCVGGYLQAAEEYGAEVTIPVIAGAPPSGPVEDEAYEYIAERIVRAAAEGPDAILLDLHGAMVSRSYEDGEGELLRRLREVVPGIPIGGAREMHANVYPELVEHATVIAGYHSYPHVDMDSTALRAGRVTLATLAGRCSLNRVRK